MNNTTLMTPGQPCPCGRKHGPQGTGIISHSVKAAGQPERFVCSTCAEEAPFCTVVRRLEARNGNSRAKNSRMVDQVRL